MSLAISVIMSVHNEEPHLRDAVGSILNQTFTDFEFIIIDDGSTDKSWQIIQEYAGTDDRIVPLTQKNIGLTSSLNKGIEIARGKYIARQDADDKSAPDRLKKQIEWFDKHSNGVLCGTQGYMINSDNKLLGKIKSLPIEYNSIRKKLKFQNVFLHTSVMMLKEAVEKVSGYDDFFRYAQDYDLWCRLANKGEMANLAELLVYQRLHDDSITNSQRGAQALYSIVAAARYCEEITGMESADIKGDVKDVVIWLEQQKTIQDHVLALRFLYSPTLDDQWKRSLGEISLRELRHCVMKAPYFLARRIFRGFLGEESFARVKGIKDSM